MFLHFSSSFLNLAGVGKGEGGGAVEFVAVLKNIENISLKTNIKLNSSKCMSHTVHQYISTSLYTTYFIICLVLFNFLTFQYLISLASSPLQ